MGRGPLLIALVAAAALVPAASAPGPAADPARGPVIAAIPLPAPGTMAERRHRLGAGPRLDHAFARQRSPAGRRIAVKLYGSGAARSRVLVAGCVNGGHCAGQQVPVLYECPPDDAELWWIPTLRPEGADLDRAPREPGAAALRQAVADLRPQVTVLYRAGPRAVVRAAGAGEAAGRRYARIAGLPFEAAAPGGLAGWVQAVRPGSAAITVELPAGRMPQLVAQRHAFALQRLAGTRFTSPVREVRTAAGAVSVLKGRFTHLATRTRPGWAPDLRLTSSMRRPEALPCDPGVVRRRLGRYGTLIEIEDRGLTRPGIAYRPRPARSRLGRLDWAPCIGPAHVVRFSDAGRNVEVVVAFGRDANRWTRRGARWVMDSIAVRP